MCDLGVNAAPMQMDIEGYEWDVIATFGTEPGWRESMPVQMAIEFHVDSARFTNNEHA
jgi:hypothetical protein